MFSTPLRNVTEEDGQPTHDPARRTRTRPVVIQYGNSHVFMSIICQLYIVDKNEKNVEVIEYVEVKQPNVM